MQTAIGNIASMRAIVAGACAPIGAEIVYLAELNLG
jgi:hypothetical protein